jgi:hypothetical protein
VRHHLEIEATYLLKGSAYKVVAMAPAAKGQGDLRVIDGNDIAGEPVVRDRDTGGRIEFEPLLRGVVANRGALHRILQS